MALRVYDFGTVATYECNPGFILVGVTTRECVKAGDGSGVFEEEAPVCERKELDKCLLHIIICSLGNHACFNLTVILTAQCDELQ